MGHITSSSLISEMGTHCPLFPYKRGGYIASSSSVTELVGLIAPRVGNRPFRIICLYGYSVYSLSDTSRCFASKSLFPKARRHSTERRGLWSWHSSTLQWSSRTKTGHLEPFNAFFFDQHPLAWHICQTSI